MVEIENITDGKKNLSFMKGLYKQLLVKYFLGEGESPDFMEAFGIGLYDINTKDHILTLYHNHGTLVVYRDFSQKQLLEFGKEYEKLSGIESLVIKKDLSKSSNSPKI